MERFERIPNELKNLDQWVCIHADSKVPMKAYEYKAASSVDPDTWSPFAMAVDAVAKGYYDNIGFVFADNGFVGIDIDDGYDEDGFLSELATDILGMCGSYTEKSRSGRGFHILLRGSLPFNGKNNLNGVEIYKASRYFIMTGDVLIFDTIRENQQAIDYVISTYFPENIRENEENQASVNPRIYHPVWEKWTGTRIPIKPTYPIIKEGGRNLSLASLAGLLHNIGYTKVQIYEELLRCNTEACKPPVKRSEIQTIVNSITRYKR